MFQSETCKNCKHWYHALWENECGKVGNDYIMRNKNKFFDIEVNVLDDSGLSVGLITGPDFGCVQFEKK